MINNYSLLQKLQDITKKIFIKCQQHSLTFEKCSKKNMLGLGSLNWTFIAV